MINEVLNNIQVTSFLGVMAAFTLTCLFIHLFYAKLPTDQGREFAHDGKLSAGKPRGAGFVFIMVFIAVAVCFGNVNTENIIYLILVFFHSASCIAEAIALISSVITKPRFLTAGQSLQSRISPTP